MNNSDRPDKENYDSMKCIWMSSNTIEYKLCDKNFDCDNCSFDKIMRNLDSEQNNDNKFEPVNTGSILDKKFEQLLSIKFSYRLHYFQNNLVLKKLFNRTYNLGFSRQAQILLEDVGSYRFFGDPVLVPAGSPFMELKGSWGTATLAAPVTLKYLGTVQRDIYKGTLSPFVTLVEADNEEINMLQIDEREFNRNIKSLVNILSKSRHKNILTGSTLNDGGLPVNRLQDAIGRSDYKKLVELLFINID